MLTPVFRFLSKATAGPKSGTISGRETVNFASCNADKVAEATWLTDGWLNDAWLTGAWLNDAWLNDAR